MKMAMLSGALLAALLGMSAPAAAGAGDAGMRPAGEDPLSALAADLEQQRDVRLAMAPVRSRAQLAEYIARTPAAASPLARLSPHARDRFVASLVFNDKGLAGFRYADLEDELTASEAYRLLALFGAEDIVPRLTRLRVETPTDRMIMDGANSRMMPLMSEDHINFNCVGRASCKYDPAYICMHSC